MGRSDDALVPGQAIAGQSDLSLVQRKYAKAGVGLSLEQKVGENLGLFVWLNWPGDKTETYALTEAGRNVSFGGLFEGMAQRRPNDVADTAFSLNMLGPDHRAYPAVGGSGAFPRDGALNYGHERVPELFCSFQPVKGLMLNPDFWSVQNFGYNRDHGPAKLCGMRVHTEFQNPRRIHMDSPSRPYSTFLSYQTDPPRGCSLLLTRRSGEVAVSVSLSDCLNQPPRIRQLMRGDCCTPRTCCAHAVKNCYT